MVHYKAEGGWRVVLQSSALNNKIVCTQGHTVQQSENQLVFLLSVIKYYKIKSIGEIYEQIFKKSKLYFPGSVFVAIISSLEDRWTGKVWGLRLACRVWRMRKSVMFKFHIYSGIVTQHLAWMQTDFIVSREL